MAPLHAALTACRSRSRRLPVASRAEVFLGYLDYFRSRLVSKLESLPDRRAAGQQAPVGLDAARTDQAPALRGAALAGVGIRGQRRRRSVGDQQDGRWHVAADETLPQLTAALTGSGGPDQAGSSARTTWRTSASPVRAMGWRRPGLAGARAVPPRPGVRPARRPARCRQRAGWRRGRRVARRHTWPARAHPGPRFRARRAPDCGNACTGGTKSSSFRYTRLRRTRPTGRSGTTALCAGPDAVRQRRSGIRETEQRPPA